LELTGLKLSKSERFKVLLEKGFLPEELPPPFTSASLARSRNSIGKDWQSLNQPKAFNYEVYSFPRLGTKRRKLSIVNPVSQFRLSEKISLSWLQIEKFIGSSKISLDIPELRNDGIRAVPKPDFGLIGLKRLDVGSEFSHILVSDISRFYGTIYTHSLPWALHGKEWCKNNLHTPTTNASLGNALEKLATKGQDNQTLGLPIGPDTSRILAEIVAVAIENDFLLKAKISASKVFRYVDDWFIGYDGAGEAEDAVAFLSKACSKYELELNHEKTFIVENTHAIEELWPAELRDHKVSSEERRQFKDLQHYFSRAFHFALQHPSENVLDFALKRARSFSVHKNNISMFESHVLRTARAYPITLPVAVQILVNLRKEGAELSTNKIRKLIVDQISTSAALGYHGEVSWALFLAKGLKIKIDAKVVEEVLLMESSVCALLVLDLRQLGLIEGPVDTTFWETFMNNEGLHSNMWLLAYEADYKGWLSSPSKHVEGHDYFRVLKKRRITFYDTLRNVPTFDKSRVLAARETARKLTNQSLLHYINKYSARSIS
jgi:Reverse transcriptase (RNA-dependent DNA polymerase)